MSLLWIPERSEPQVTKEAREALTAEFKEAGSIVPLIKTGREVINNEEHQAFRSYIDELGFDLNCRSLEGAWPHRALKSGGSIAMHAYRKAGYQQNIGEFALTTGQFAAEIDGIPEAYFSSLNEDFNLTAIMMMVLESDDLRAPDPSGYYEVMGIGAGCVRFYMEKELAA